MLTGTELLQPAPSPPWRLVKQARYREHGLELAVIEDTAPVALGYVAGLRDAACGRPPSRYSRRVTPDVLR